MLIAQLLIAFITHKRYALIKNQNQVLLRLTSEADNGISEPISKRSKLRRNEKAQEIFSLLTSRYNTNLNGFKWKKAKRYIYHATSPSSTKNPISIEQIISVLDFLDETLEDGKDIGAAIDSLMIIQEIPRIFRKDAQSYLRPTVNFLKKLYGSQMFYESLHRRPDVLLTSGVGYNLKSKEGETLNSDESGDNNNSNGKISVEIYLVSKNFGISESQISKMKKTYPTVFQQSTVKVQSVVEYLLSEIQSPSESSSSASPALKDLLIVGKIIRANPNIVHLSLINLKNKIDFFGECGFDNSEKLIGLLRKFPGVLGLSLEENLRPTLDLLLDMMDLGMHAENLDDSSIRTTALSKSYLYKTLSLHPQLLALSPKNLEFKASYFENLNQSGGSKGKSMGDKSLAARILSLAPSVYSLSLENNIVPKVEALSNLWGSCSDSPGIDSDLKISPTVAKQIYDYPNVLTLSLDGNIAPTISFYNRTGYLANIPKDEEKSASNEKSKRDTTKMKSTEKSPSSTPHVYLPARYLAASLYNRLLPRWNYHIIQEAEKINNQDEDTRRATLTPKSSKGNDQDDPSVLPVSRPPLHVIAGATDQAFCGRMGYDCGLYLKFKQEAIPRLKFSSQFDTWLKTGRPIDIDVD